MAEMGTTAIPRVPIRAVIDTSSLVPFILRRDLLVAAHEGLFTAIWSPWIIAELNRVLTWRWIARHGDDISPATQQACSAAAKAMMTLLLPAFTLVNPLPPYPIPWATLRDQWDLPIWAAAVAGQAQYVISENHHDYPPREEDGRHRYQGIEYLSGEEGIS
jgi:predicted nucleic acid-binding protein